MSRRLVVIVLLISSLLLFLSLSVVLFTPAASTLGLVSPTPTPTLIPYTPTPFPTPKPILTARGKPPKVTAEVSYLVDMDSGQVLINNNGEKPLPMASTTKIMTALIALQSGNLQRRIVIQQRHIDHALLNDGSNAGLYVNDTLSLLDLVYALMLPSGDDAAVAIAETLAGSKEQFVDQMNHLAYRLRLFQTYYSNPDGLPLDNSDHYTTASDLARLANYAMSNPLFAKIVKTSVYTLKATADHHAYTWANTNKLLDKYRGMLGIKTGHTLEAGYCLVFAATRNGHRLLGVLLHSASDEERFQEARAVLDWGFSLPSLPPF